MALPSPLLLRFFLCWDDEEEEEESESEPEGAELLGEAARGRVSRSRSSAPPAEPMTPMTRRTRGLAAWSTTRTPGDGREGARLSECRANPKLTNSNEFWKRAPV